MRVLHLNDPTRPGLALCGTSRSPFQDDDESEDPTACPVCADMIGLSVPGLNDNDPERDSLVLFDHLFGHP